MGAQRRTDPERRLRDLATRQFGLLDHADLVEEGLTRNEIAGRLRMSSLTRIHRRVYAFGHTALRPEGRWLAALWACGWPTAG